jgi:hypothetical protein
MQKPPAVTSRTSARSGRTRLAALMLLLPSLTGCGDSPLASAAGYFRTGVLGGADLAMTRADLAKIPYAAIGVREGRGPQAFVVLAKIDATSQQWISADKHLIETRNGRITKTIGFDTDLTHTDFITPDPIQAHLDPGKTYALDRLVDVTDHAGITGDVPTDAILVRSILTCQGPRTITILGTPIQTNLWNETVTAPDIKWSATNKYWQDQTTRTIWKTQQHITPKSPQIDIELLRRYE